MDISSIQAMANQYTSESSSTKKLQNSLKNDYSEATSEELMDVCKEFEAYFVEQIFKEMRKTIPESESTSSYSSTMKEYYEEVNESDLANAAINGSRANAKLGFVTFQVSFSPLTTSCSCSVVFVVTDKFGIYYMVSKIIATVFVMIFNFVTRKKFLE